ncbi:MAG: hypothetical protein WAW57_14790 [Lutibacter sp.]
MKSNTLNFLLIMIFISVGCTKKEKELKQKKEIKPYLEFLKNEHTSAKDYIINLFEQNDLVILCERDHRENTQYGFLKELMSDPRFIKNVGNVFTEIGMINLNPGLNNFIHSENYSEEQIHKKLIEFQRKAGYYPLWGSFNFYSLNKQLYNTNQSLSSEEKINIYPSNIALKLDSLDTEYYKSIWNSVIYHRDSLMANSIIENFEKIKKSGSSRKKALIIMNFRHAFNKNFEMENGNIVENVGGFLFKKYSGKIANVLINQFEFTDAETEQEITYKSAQDGKWDAAFEVLNIDNSGFDFKTSPFGEDNFDLWPFHSHNYKYKDIFTGFVYYKKPIDFKLITGINGLIDSTFIKTYKKRVLLWKEITNNRVDYPLVDSIIIGEYGQKKEFQIERIDSVSAQINKWIEK